MHKGFIVIRHDEDGASRVRLHGRGVRLYGWDDDAKATGRGPTPLSYEWGPGTVMTLRDATRLAAKLRKRWARRRSGEIAVFKVRGVYCDRYGAQRLITRSK